jgi:hypothetical protein
MNIWYYFCTVYQLFSENLHLFEKLVILMSHIQNQPFFLVVLKANLILSKKKCDLGMKNPTPLKDRSEGRFHLRADLESDLRSDLKPDFDSEGGSCTRRTHNIFLLTINFS